MEPEQTNLAALFPAIAAQMRGALSNLHLAAAQLAPESAREQDPRLDARAAVLDQSYYQLLRLVNTLFVGEYDETEVVDAALEGMVSRLGDRWSYYLTAEELEAVTTAGTWAATAMGRQSPVMVAVQDKETLAELSRLNAAVMGTQNDPFYGAPTAVLVLGEKNNPNGVQDASLVMGNLLLAASGIGLGSCWINRAKETFETPEGKALLAKWGLDPEKYIGVGYCILGYPAPNGTRTPGPRKAGYVLHV